MFAVVRGLSWAEKIEAIEIGCEGSLARQVHISPVVMAEADFDSSCSASGFCDAGRALLRGGGWMQ